METNKCDVCDTELTFGVCEKCEPFPEWQPPPTKTPIACPEVYIKHDGMGHLIIKAHEKFGPMPQRIVDAINAIKEKYLRVPLTSLTMDYLKAELNGVYYWEVVHGRLLYRDNVWTWVK